MNFEVKKIENCFSDSKTFEYTLPIDGNSMLENLTDWQIRKNEKLRRPVAVAQRENVIIKFVLADKHFRVSFPDNQWQAEKEKFELFLENIVCSG